MATGLYDTGRNAFLTGTGTTGGQIDWQANTISAALVHNSAGGTSYTPDLALHQYYSSIPAGSVVAGAIASSVNLGTKTNVAGVAGCANIRFAGVSGVQVDAVVIYKNNGGTAASSQLIAYIDSAGATGLPVVPNGSDITLTIDVGANKLFKL